MKTAELPKPTKRNSVEICGQLWHMSTSRYRSYDTMGSSTEKIVNATRYADGRTVSGSDKTRLIAVIADRIAQRIY